MGELVAVLSGKGGTGKTSICAGLASSLAQAGEKVLCIDCDIGLRNLDIALGMSDVGALSFLEGCRGEYPLSMAAKHPLYTNLYFLTAPMHCTADEIDPMAFAAMLSFVFGMLMAVLKLRERRRMREISTSRRLDHD